MKRNGRKYDKEIGEETGMVEREEGMRVNKQERVEGKIKKKAVWKITRLEGWKRNKNG